MRKPPTSFLIFLLLGIMIFESPVFLTIINSTSSILRSNNNSVFYDDDSIWNVTLGGLEHDSGSSIIECSGGGYAIGGTTTNQTSGDTDFWLIRLDAAGNALWDRTYGTIEREWCEDVIECSDGGFALVGSYGVLYPYGQKGFFVRVNATGHLLWSHTLEVYSFLAGDYLKSIVECSTGGFAIGGHSSPSRYAGFDAWLIRTDEDGNVLWNYTYGGTGWDMDECLSLIESSNGDFVLAGYTESFATAGFDVWVIRTNSLGHPLWNHTYGGSGWEKGNSIIELPNGNFVITGYTDSFGAGVTDEWLLRIDAMGTPIWQPTAGGVAYDEGFDVVLCQDGGFAIAGFTDSFSTGLSDVWLIRTNPQGETLWTYAIGGPDYEIGRSLIETSDGSFLIVGYTGDSFASSHDLFLVHVPASPPTTPTGPTTPLTGPIDLGILLAIVVPVVIAGVAISVIIFVWQRRRQKGK